jgi:hypothetical protein
MILQGVTVRHPARNQVCKGAGAPWLTLLRKSAQIGPQQASRSVGMVWESRLQGVQGERMATSLHPGQQAYSVH